MKGMRPHYYLCRYWDHYHNKEFVIVVKASNYNSVRGTLLARNRELLEKVPYWDFKQAEGAKIDIMYRISQEEDAKINNEILTEILHLIPLDSTTVRVVR